MLSTEDRFTNGCYLQKMSSSTGAIYRRWVHQRVLSTEDEFINGCYLQKMSSSVGAIYRRWVHQRVLSTEDEVINGCYLQKMRSSIGAIYRRWVHQWVLSTDMTEDEFINWCFLRRWVHQYIGAVYRPTENDFINIGAIYTENDFISIYIYRRMISLSVGVSSLIGGWFCKGCYLQMMGSSRGTISAA